MEIDKDQSMENITKSTKIEIVEFGVEPISNLDQIDMKTKIDPRSSKIREYKCPVCSEQFPTMNELEYHAFDKLHRL